MARNELVINIRINEDGLDRGLNQLRRLFGDIDGGMRDSQRRVRGLNNEFGNVNNTIGSLQRSILGLGGVIAGGLGIGNLISTVADFEAQMDKVSAIARIDVNTKEGQQAYKELEDAARLAGATTKFSATEAAEALEFMAMAGWDVQKSIDALPRMLALSSSSGLELARTSDIATNVFSALKLEISQFPRLVDSMAYTTATANTNLEQLGESAKYAAPIFAAAGFEVEDLTASIGLLANIGIQGSSSGTALRMGVLRLASGSTEAKKAMDTLGFSVANADGSVKEFVPMVTELAKKMSGLVDTEKLKSLKDIFGVEAGPGWKELLSQTEALRNSSRDVMEEYNVSLEKADGTTKDAITAINELGVSIQDLSRGKQKEILQELFRTDEISDDVLDLVNSTDQFGTALGKQNSLVLLATNRLAEYHDEQLKSAGTADKMSKTMIDNLKGDWKILESTLQEAFLIAGETIAPVLRDIVQKVTELVQAMYPFMGMVKTLLEIAGAFLAMKGAMLLVGGLSTAMIALQGATLLTASANLVLQGRFWSWAASIKAADGALMKLRLTMVGIASFAASAFMIAFIGWEIGKYFWNEFEEVRKASYWAIGEILIGWERVQQFVENIPSYAKNTMIVVFGIIREGFSYVSSFFEFLSQRISDFFTNAIIYIKKQLISLMETTSEALYAMDMLPGAIESASSLGSKTGIMSAGIKRQEQEIQNRKTLSQLIDDNRSSIQQETFSMLEMVDAENSVNDEHERNIQLLRESQADLIASTSAQENATDAVKNSLKAKEKIKEQQEGLSELQKIAAQDEMQSLSDLEKANVKIVDAIAEANKALQMSILRGKKETIEFEVEFEFGDTNKAKELAKIQLMVEYYKDITTLQYELTKATMSVAEAKEYDAKLNYGEELSKQYSALQNNVDVTKALHSAMVDFQKSNLSKIEAIKFDVKLELGDAGKDVAQIKILTEVNNELVKSQGELAKATMTVAQAKEYDLSLQYGDEYGKLFAQVIQNTEALKELTNSTTEFTTASLSAKDARVANLKLQYPDYLAKELALSEQITSARKDLTNAMLEYNKAGMTELQAKADDLSQQYNESIANNIALIGSLTQAKQALSDINDKVATSEMTVWKARQFELEKKYPEVIAQQIAQLEMLVATQAKVIELSRQLETASMSELDARKAQLSLEMPSYMAEIIANTEALIKFEGDLANTTRELAQATMTEYESRVANLSLKYPASLAKEYATLQTLVEARKELTATVTEFNEVGLTEYELQQKRLSLKLGDSVGSEIAQLKQLTQVKIALLSAETELSNIGLSAFELREKQLQLQFGEKYGSEVASVKNLIDIKNEQLRLEQELAKTGGDESLNRRLELEKQFPSVIAEQIVQIERLTALRQAQLSAETQANEMLSSANLTDKQREYVSVLKEVGLEIGKQVIQTQELAQARMDGVKVIADMQKEISTMGFSDTEKERYELLKQVAPEQQKIVNQLYNEKQALIENQKELEANRNEWIAIADSAGNYFEKFIEGEMSASEALEGFFDDLVKQQRKAIIEQAKEQFLNIVVGTDEKDDQQKVIDAVNATRDMIKSDIDKASQFVAENVSGSALELGRISSETIQQMTNSLSQSYEVNTQQLRANVEESGQKLASSIDTSITTLTTNTQQNIQAIVDGMSNVFSQFSSNLNQAIESTSKSLNQGIEQTVQILAGTLDKTLTTLNVSITGNIERISKAMEIAATGMSNTLKSMVETLGQAANGMVSAGQSVQTASESFQGVAKNLPDIFKGIKGTAEGLIIKGGYKGGKGQAVSGGKTHEAAFALAQIIQKMLGNKLRDFTGFNDEYHHSAKYKAKKRAAGQSEYSVHQTGRALDVVLKPQFAKLHAQVNQQIKDIGKMAGVTISTLDEYVKKTSGGTGKHIHVNFKSQADADKFTNFIKSGGQAIQQFSQQTQVATKAVQASAVALKGSTDVTQKSSYTTKDSMKIVASTAKKFGIEVSDFLTMAQTESGFQADASRGEGGAKGLFQFIPSTAKQYGIKGQELNPFKNAEAAAKLWHDNAKVIAKLFGKEESGNLRYQYLAHQQGTGGLKQISRAASGGQAVSENVRKNMLNNIMGDVKEMIGITKSQLKAMSTANPQEFARKFLEAWEKKIPQRKADALAQVQKVAGDVFAVEKGALKQAQVITAQDVGNVQALQQSSIDVAKAQQEITNISKNAANELQALAVSGTDTTQAFKQLTQDTPKIDLAPLDLETQIIANLPNIESNLSNAINEGIAVADTVAANEIKPDLTITTDTLANSFKNVGLDAQLAEKIKEFSVISFDETGQALVNKLSIQEMDSKVATAIQSLALAEFNLTSEQVASGISEELKGKLDNRIVELVRNQAVFDLGYTAQDIASGLSQEGINKVDTRIAEILKQQAINELGLTQETIAQGLTDATKDKIDDRVAELLRNQVAFELKGTAVEISELSKDELAKVDERVKQIITNSNISLNETGNAVAKNVVDATLLFDKKIAQNVTSRAKAKLDFTEDAISKNLNHELIRLDKSIVDELKQIGQLGLTKEEIDSGVFDDQIANQMTESLRSFVLGSMELTEQDLANDPVKADQVEQRIAELMKAPLEVIEKSDEIVLNELRQAVSKGMGFSGTMEEIASLTTDALGEIDGNILDYLRQETALELGLSEQAIAGKLNDEALAKIDINVAQKLRSMLIEKMGYTEQQIADNVGGAADKIDENLAQLLSQLSPSLDQSAMQMAVDLSKATGIALDEAIKQVTAKMGGAGGGAGGGLLGGSDNAFGWVKELSSTFSGEGIMGSIGSMFSGDGALGSVGKSFTEGLFSKSGSIGSLFSESGAIGGATKAIGGFGNALGIGKSVLEKDWAGALSATANAVGTAFGGPLAGAAASAAVDFLKVGAQWVRESEWVRASIRGTTEGLVGEFDKGFKEVKDSMIGGGERSGYEALDDATIEQLNEALGKTSDVIRDISKSLGSDSNALLGSLTNFQFHIERMYSDDGDAEYLAEKMSEMAISTIKKSIAAIKIEDVDDEIGSMMSDEIGRIMYQVVMGTFSEENRAEMWDGIMDNLNAMEHELRIPIAEAITEQMSSYVSTMNDALLSGDISDEELKTNLTNKLQELFIGIAQTPLPTGVAEELALRISEGIYSAMDFIQTGMADFVVTTDKEFFQYLRKAVADFETFEGSEEELTALINGLLNLKDAFNEVGLSTAFINESMTTALGGVEGYNEAIGTLTSKFLDTNEAFAFASSLDTVDKAIAKVGITLTTTRDEFNLLIRGLDATTESGQETFKSLLQNVDSFDKFYAGIEWFEESFSSVTKKTTKDLQQYVGQVEDGFKELGIEVPKTRKEFYNLVSALDLTQEKDRQLYSSLISLAPAFDNFHTAFESIKEQFFSFQPSDLNLLDTIFSASNAEEAGKNFSNNFMTSFYDQFIGGFMSVIEQTVFDSIVTPLTNSATAMAMNISEGGVNAAMNVSEGGINAAMNMAEGGISSASNIVNGSVTAQTQMATGGATAGMLLTSSGQLTASALAGVVAQVEQQLGIMTQVMSALSESGVMENVATAMADIGSSAFSSVTSMQAPMQTYQTATPDRFGGMFNPEKDEDSGGDSGGGSSGDDLQNKLEENLKAFDSWKESITDFNSGLEGNELTLHNLNNKYGDIFDTAGKSAQELGEEWGKLSQSDLEGMAQRAGVELGELTGDLHSFLTATDEVSKATKEFNDGIIEQLAEFGLEGIDLDIFNWEKEAQDLRTQAMEAGGDLLSVEELIAKKRQQIDSDYAKQITDFQKGLTDELATIDLEGIELEMFNLDQWKSEQVKQANELGADLTNIDALYNAKRLKIEEDFNKQRIEYNQGIQQEIESLTLGDFDLELLELDRWYQSQVEAAQEVDGDLEQLNQLYQLKQQQILDTQTKLVTDLQSSFDGMATGLEGTALEIYKLEQQFSGLDAKTLALTMSSEDYAKWVQSLSYDDLVEMSEKYGVTIDELTGGIENLGSIIKDTDDKVQDFNKSMSEQAKEFGMDQFKLTSDEQTLIDLSTLLPDLDVLGLALTTDLGELTANLATANKEQLATIAESLGIPLDVFIEKVPQFISASDSVQKSWDTFKEGLKGLTQESNGTLATIKALGEQFPQFNLVADSATLNIEDATTALMNMTEVELLAYLQATGMGLDEAGKATLEYLNAVKSLQQGMEGFRNDMATTVMQLNGMSNAQISLQKLGGSFSQFGNTAIDVATNLSTLSNESILGLAQELDIEPDEIYKQGTEYVNALKSTEDEAAKAREDALKAQEEAQKDALKAQEEAQKDALKAQEDYQKKLIDQIKNLRSLFDELSDGLKSVYDAIQSNIESFTPEDVLKAQKTIELKELRGKVANIDLSKVSMDDPDFVRAITEDFSKLNDLVMSDAQDRIAAVETERDKARELHEQKIQQYEEEADRLKQLFDDAMGVVDSISDDVFQIEKSMGKAGTSPLDILDKERKKFANATTPESKIESASLLRNSIKEAMDFQIGEVEKNYDVQVDLINENFDKQKESLETARDNQIANIEAQADAERKAAESAHDSILAQLESAHEVQQASIEAEFEAKKSALEAQQAAAEELRDFLLDLKDQIKGVRDSLTEDMLSLRRELGDPKASFKYLADAMRGQISGAMQPTAENIAKVDEYRSLVLESMNEQIEKEQEKADLIAEQQQTQLDNAQSLRDFAKDLKGWLDDIALSDLSNLTNRERLIESERQYQETLKAASSGDETARSELTQKADQYLQEAQSFYASSGPYTGETGIYENVRSQISGLATTSQAKAASIEKQVHIDQTVTGQSTSAIKIIQETALAELQRLDAIMAGMNENILAQLATPAATPLPEEQFQAQLNAIESQKIALLEQSRLEYESNVVNENARFELEQQMINQREALAKENAQAKYEFELALAEEQRQADLEKAELDKEDMITAIKEAYITELTDISLQMTQAADTLMLMYDKQIELASKSFAEDPWAQSIIKVQEQSLFELASMKDSIVGANEILGIQMQDAISQLMAGLSSTSIQELPQGILDIPSFDVGTPYVASDTLANVHEGEMIIDPVTSRQLRQYGINVTAGGNKTDTSKVEELLTILLEQVQMSRQDSAKDTSLLVEAIDGLEEIVTIPLNKTLKGIESKENGRKRR